MSKKTLTYISEEAPEKGGKLEKLKKQLKICQKEKEEYLVQVQRARADFINYQRRQEQVLEEFKKYNQAELIRELLPVLDSLEAGSLKNEGLKKIKEQLIIVLSKQGLKEIKTAGEKFNPQFHEAVDQIELDVQSDMIVDETQKGYLLGDKVLRPSKVRVAK